MEHERKKDWLKTLSKMKKRKPGEVLDPTLGSESRRLEQQEHERLTQLEEEEAQKELDQVVDDIVKSGCWLGGPTAKVWM